MAAGDGCSKGTLIDSWICWQLYYHGHWGWSKTHSSNTYNDYIYNAVGGILNGSYDIWRFRWSKGIYAYVSGYVPSYNRWINNLWCLMMYIRRTISSCNILLSFATGQQSDWYNPVYGIFCSVWRVFFSEGALDIQVSGHVEPVGAMNWVAQAWSLMSSSEKKHEHF